MRKINLIIMIAAVLISVSASAQGVLCTKDSPSGVLYTMKGGKCWSYSCENGKAIYKSEEETAKCGIGVCKAGEKRTMTPQGKKCEQTCCADGTWSGCNRSCDNHGCDKNECYDGNRCRVKPSGDYKETKDKCEYRYNCKEYGCGDRGWVCKKKELKEVINYNERVQKGKWNIKGEYKGQGSKCGAGIVVNEKTATEDCIKYHASLIGKSVGEMKKLNATFRGQCYIQDDNGDYSILECSAEQKECKE